MKDHNISRDKRVPLKYQIADYIRGKIENEEYKPGNQIPTERELSTQFGVSKITVVNALNHLVPEGLIERIQGKGSFVKKPRLTRDLENPHKGFTDFFKDEGVPSQSLVLKTVKMIAPQEVTKELNLEIGADVIMLRRLRFVNDEPVAITTSFFDTDIGAGLLKLEVGQNVSVYDYLVRETGKQVVAGPIYLEPTPLNNAQAKLLNVSVGCCGCITKTTSLVENTTVEYVHSILRGDKFRFVVHRINYGSTSESLAIHIL